MRHNFKVDVDNLSKSRLRSYKRNLEIFSAFTHRNNLNISNLSISQLHKYIVERSSSGVKAYDSVPPVKAFLKYLYEMKHVEKDMSERIMTHRIIQQPTLPSVFSAEEINHLLSSIDLTTKKGLRNKAMVQLLAELGLRGSDVANLKLDNIDWEKEEILISQVKTKKRLKIPYSAEVGNALADYILNARPKTAKVRNVFLSVRPPHRHLPSSAAVSSVVRRAFKNASINTTGRRFGAHALRHSVGSRLLDEGIPVSDVAGILGINLTTAADNYMQIDLKSMRLCPLEVPLLK